MNIEILQISEIDPVAKEASAWTMKGVSLPKLTDRQASLIHNRALRLNLFVFAL